MGDILEVFFSERKSKIDPVTQSDLDDFKLIFYVVSIVFGGAIVILIAAVIGLFAWVMKLSNENKKNKNAELSGITDRLPHPGEELAKRYTMSIEDEKKLKEIPTLRSDDQYPFSREPSPKQPDILRNGNLKSITNGKESKTPFSKRNQSPAFAENKRLGDRFGDDLYY